MLFEPHRPPTRRERLTSVMIYAGILLAAWIIWGASSRHPSDRDKPKAGQGYVIPIQVHPDFRLAGDLLLVSAGEPN